MKIISLLLLWCCGQVSHAQSTQPTIYYVGNMGVAVVKNDSVILIDALHDYYDVYYLPSDTVLLQKIQQQEKPFRQLIAILATHMHHDHFDDFLITRVNQQNNASTIVTGKQPASFLSSRDRLRLQIIDQIGTVSLSDQLKITLKNVGHTGARHQTVENYRIELTWGNFRLVHFGDAALNTQTLDGLTDGIDVAIVPYWFCYDATDIQLLEQKKFKKIIATHIDPKGAAPFGKSSIEIISFMRYGQSYSWK